MWTFTFVVYWWHHAALTPYAMRDPDACTRQAAQVGPAVEQFVRVLLAGVFPGRAYVRPRSCCASPTVMGPRASTPPARAPSGSS